MNRRYFLTTMIAIAVAGCGVTSSPSSSENSPPPGAKLVVVNLPGMT